MSLKRNPCGPSLIAQSWPHLHRFVQFLFLLVTNQMMLSRSTPFRNDSLLIFGVLVHQKLTFDPWDLWKNRSFKSHEFGVRGLQSAGCLLGPAIGGMVAPYSRADNDAPCREKGSLNDQTPPVKKGEVGGRRLLIANLVCVYIYINMCIIYIYI